jgi:hypothetical protein
VLGLSHISDRAAEFVSGDLLVVDEQQGEYNLVHGTFEAGAALFVEGLGPGVAE